MGGGSVLHVRRATGSQQHDVLRLFSKTPALLKIGSWTHRFALISVWLVDDRRFEADQKPCMFFNQGWEGVCDVARLRPPGHASLHVCCGLVVGSRMSSNNARQIRSPEAVGSGPVPRSTPLNQQSKGLDNVGRSVGVCLARHARLHKRTSRGTSAREGKNRPSPPGESRTKTVFLGLYLYIQVTAGWFQRDMDERAKPHSWRANAAASKASSHDINLTAYARRESVTTHPLRREPPWAWRCSRRVSPQTAAALIAFLTHARSASFSCSVTWTRYTYIAACGDFQPQQHCCCWRQHSPLQHHQQLHRRAQEEAPLCQRSAGLDGCQSHSTGSLGSNHWTLSGALSCSTTAAQQRVSQWDWML
jgi:hypothetical protein